eukprot:TRINITY_DN2508_c0_g1_i3.p1 TRINITY_DN2508_c0_g1~~TRINITY_DN2508_c0_g1_i3.p1  ORF type:complete len:135 (+),score=25.39 TRINITY_DN2508_c0_g1_i3:46-450(+)
MKPIYSIFISNRSGTLTFLNNYKESTKKISYDQGLDLTSMLHALQLLLVQLSPIPIDSGMKELTFGQYKMVCLTTPTKLTICAITDVITQGIEDLLDEIYFLYCNYALKNPFQRQDMPIKSELFEQKLKDLIYK